MECLDTYQRENFNLIADPSARNYLVGAGTFGSLLTARCKELEIVLEGVCDNSPDMIGKRLDEVEIKPLGETVSKYPGDNFILAISKPDALAAVVEQLERLGAKRCFDAQFIRKFLSSPENTHLNTTRDSEKELYDMEWLANVQADFFWRRSIDHASENTTDHIEPRVLWGSRTDARRLGVLLPYTRKWAYGWIIDSLRKAGRIETIADIGGGDVNAYFARRLSHYADTVLIVDQIGRNGEQSGNVRQVVANMEEGISALADESVDVIVSASAIEHLSKVGQNRIFAEINRILKPGGFFCGTISYTTNLTEETLCILNRDSVLQAIGSPISARIDLKELLANAPGLSHPDCLEHFPGGRFFTDEALFADAALLHDFVGDYEGVKVSPEVNALSLKWYELGLLLPKEAAIGPNAKTL